jgi:predicted NBD/HSP70 family sugar kinase
MHLLFDIGGTKARFATSSGEEPENIKIIETPDRFEDGIKEFRNYYDSIGNPNIESVSGGIAGPLNKEKTMVINAPNISGWNGKPLKEELIKIFNTNIKIENDAALFGLGEATYGSGKEKKIVMFLTISTGIGGARIVNGKIDENSMGFEPGHQLLFLNEKEVKHLEGLASGNAIKRIYGKNPQDIDDEETWDEVAKYLAYGIHNSILHWSPDVVILGGSVMKKMNIEKVKEHLSEIMKIFLVVPEIRLAQLGDKGGLYGALELAKK